MRDARGSRELCRKATVVEIRGAKLARRLVTNHHHRYHHHHHHHHHTDSPTVRSRGAAPRPAWPRLVLPSRPATCTATRLHIRPRPCRRLPVADWPALRMRNQRPFALMESWVRANMVDMVPLRASDCRVLAATAALVPASDCDGSYASATQMRPYSCWSGTCIHAHMYIVLHIFYPDM